MKIKYDKEIENARCKKCDIKNNCPLYNIIEYCPYIENRIPPIVMGDKTRTKKEITDAAFNFYISIACIILIVLYLIFFKK